MCEFAHDQLLIWMQIKMTDFCDSEVCCSIACVPRSLRRGLAESQNFILLELLSKSSITKTSPNVTQTFTVF